MRAVRDVAVVGGGPAGLAHAIAAAQAGFDVLVLERRQLPADKACGEGVLPGGVRALRALGVLPHLAPDGVSPIHAIRWLDEACCAEARLPGPGGLGVRRTALSAALLARARALGVEVRTGAVVRDHRRLADLVEVVLPEGVERARLLVAADGLRSAVREREGLDAPVAAAPRFGIRRHFAVARAADAVEVHFADGVEAYVTPAGAGCLGVAFLFEAAARAPYPALLARFPALRARVTGAAHLSATAGAGPFARAVRARALDRLVLVGDAAGYRDAITGEGLSLAFRGAAALGAQLPAILAAEASRASLAAWARGEALRFAAHRATTRAVLELARRGPVRRSVLPFLAAHPRLFAQIVGAAVG